MSPSAADREQAATRAATLVELVIVVVVTSIVFLVTPILVFHGVKTLVFLPKALAVNHAATEVLHQMVEGGFSTLQSTPVRGLRFANRTLPFGGNTVQPAIWNAQPSQVGFRTSDTECVTIQLSGVVINRRVATVAAGAACVDPGPPGEDIPYQDVSGSVQITPAGSLFTYYNPGGGIRRVDIAFTAQTGSGNFDQGDTSETITSSVAIRVP